VLAARLVEEGQAPAAAAREAAALTGHKNSGISRLLTAQTEDAE
jgi:hypothetical protein